jgi:multidrug efflux pump subunit AcrB
LSLSTTVGLEFNATFHSNLPIFSVPVNGAALPSPYGGKILQVQVDLDQQAMQAHGVSADDVVNAIAEQNLVLPAARAHIK